MTKFGVTVITSLGIWLLLAFLLTGCTFARYQDAERSLTVVDFRPMGQRIELDAKLNDKGSLSVNREQESAAEVIQEVGDAFKPGINL
jgi:hypothetical protein